jgi:hypothetical protein
LFQLSFSFEEMDVNDIDFNSKLISLYEAHKVLYDKNYRLDGYTGKLEQVNQAWLEIAYNLELGGYSKFIKFYFK